jgi:tetratricopeptide (TPR) repeat protein
MSGKDPEPSVDDAAMSPTERAARVAGELRAASEKLRSSSRMLGGPSRKALTQAEEKCLNAIKIDPNSIIGNLSLASVLLQTVDHTSGKARKDILRRAGTSLARAAELDPNNFSVKSGQRALALHEAREAPAEKSLELFSQAVSDLEALVQQHPDKQEAHQMLGAALTRVAALSSDNERAKRLELAADSFRKAKEVGGKANFGEACFYAVADRKEDAIRELQEASTQGRLPSAERLSSEAALDSLRNDTRFQELLKRRSSKE